jgi:Cu(I)/Ag(I) efflux system protein CusF
MKKFFFSPVALLLIMAASTVFAQSIGGSTPAARTATDMIDGEVRKIDKGTRTITLRHGEIKPLNMPPMTMVFEAKEPAMLDKVKVGDKVKFKAANVGGTFTVTEIEAAK